MTDQSTVHDARQSVGALRQPSHRLSLDELHVILLSQGCSHPYELGYDDRRALETNAAYARGGRGMPASLPSDGYLYRISGAKSVARSVSELRLGDVTGEEPEEIIWDAFNDLTYPHEWRKLSRYAGGILTGRRDITWWTSHILGTANIVSGAHRMGMYGLWIPIYSLLLRCPVKYLAHNNPLVPTVLDAFDQEVFHPTKDIDAPTCGVTISLEHAGALNLGVDEFVIGSVPIDEIEVLPVYVDSKKRLGHTPMEQGPTCWSLLSDYLRTL